MSYLLNAEFKRQGLLGSPSANQNSDVAGRHSRLKRQRGRLWLCAWMVVTLVQGARAADSLAAARENDNPFSEAQFRTTGGVSADLFTWYRPLEQTQATGSIVALRLDGSHLSPGSPGRGAFSGTTTRTNTGHRLDRNGTRTVFGVSRGADRALNQSSAVADLGSRRC